MIVKRSEVYTEEFEQKLAKDKKMAQDMRKHSFFYCLDEFSGFSKDQVNYLKERYK